MVRIVSFGVGNRGGKYLQWVHEHPEEASITAIVDPDSRRLSLAASKYALSENQCFQSAEEFFASSAVADAAIIAAPDREHKPIAMECISRGWHILLEKPIATSREDCFSIAAAAKKAGVYVSVCFILRLHPYWQKTREIISNPRFGRILSIHHEVNAGIDRCVHTFVRGNWSRAEDSAPLILSKCCHDMDLLLFLSGSTPRKTVSFGSLGWFRKENAPQGAASRCIDCKIEPDCPFSAVDLYRRRNLWNENFPRMPYESVGDAVERELREGRYGRCAYRCDNDVTDHQSVMMEMEDGAVVSMRMNFLTMEDNRFTAINASGGELRGDESRLFIRYFDSGESITIDMSGQTPRHLHAGADHEIVHDFVSRIREGNFNSPTEISEALPGHYACFEAERFRLDGEQL